MQVWLGAKRTISVTGWERFLRVTFFWRTLFPALAKVYGYIPAKKFRLGTSVSRWLRRMSTLCTSVYTFAHPMRVPSMPSRRLRRILIRAMQEGTMSRCGT